MMFSSRIVLRKLLEMISIGGHEKNPSFSLNDGFDGAGLVLINCGTVSTMSYQVIHD